MAPQNHLMNGLFYNWQMKFGCEGVCRKCYQRF